MTIWEKVSNIIIKKCNSGIRYNKNYLKTEKRFNTKEGFQCFFFFFFFFAFVFTG